MYIKGKWIFRLFILKLLLLVIGLILLFFYNLRINNSYNQEKTVFLIDISNSMNVLDIQTTGGKISRLDTAKKAIKSTINQISQNNPTHHRGVVLFHQTANYYYVPSSDTGLAIEYVNAIHTNMLSGQNTNLIDAISFVTQNTSGSGYNLIVLSDGEFSLKSDVMNSSLVNLILIRIGTQNGGIVRTANNEPLNITSKASSDFINKLAHEKSFIIDYRDNGGELTSSIFGFYSFMTDKLMLFSIFAICITFILI